MYRHSYFIFLKMDPRFKSPCSIIIAGPSQSGKTTFTVSLLKNKTIFNKDIKKIVYCYGTWQDNFNKMKKEIKGIQFYEGIPDNINSLFKLNERPGILILDDLMHDCTSSQQVVDLFTRGSHHCDITTLYLTQNLFPQGKNARTISLNAHYIIAFKNPRDALSVRILAQQAFPHKVPFVMESFQDATTKPYGYLLFDLHPSTPEEYRLRANILDPYPLAYKESNI